MAEKHNVSDAERRARSIRARRLYAQGRFGGKGMGQGRKKVKTATEILAAKAVENADLMEKVLVEAMEGTAIPASVKIKAVETFLKIERDHIQMEREEETALNGLSQAQIIEALAPRLIKLVASGAIELPALPRVGEITVEPIEEMG